MMTIVKRVLPLLCAMVLAGCAAAPPYDYTAFRANRPGSILVLPPVNSSMELAASYAVLSNSTYPLAEAGYYVLPVALVDETFKQNGLTAPDEMHNAPPQKLREIFGADAALYMEVLDYGASYNVVSSDVRAKVKGQLVDLRSGDVLWSGEASASSAENQNQGISSNSLLATLVVALVNQVINTVDEDRGVKMAGIATQRLLGVRSGGLLYGPRSPNYLSESP